jgi:hypothetical protein
MRRTSKTPVQLVNSADEAFCQLQVLADEAIEKAEAKAAAKAEGEKDGDSKKKEEAPESAALENEVSDCLADLKVLLYGDINCKVTLEDQLDEGIVRDICLVVQKDDLIAKLLPDIQVG